jgi:MoaA/NifB/PqqE/SkfB family radical SAM enzyme
MSPVVSKLPILVLYPHSRCNCRCLMCDIWKETTAREISAAELERHAADIEALGVEWVVLSGGEPLMHSDLFRLCRILRSLRIRITLLSSGLLLRRHADAITGHVDEVIVSLDGPEPVHDAIRGVPGAFRLLKEGLEPLRVPVDARCTVQGRNCTHLIGTADVAHTLGLRSVSFLAADTTTGAFNHPGGWTPERASLIALDSAQLAGLEHEIERLIRERAHDIASRFIRESPEKLRRIAAHFGPAAPVSPRCNAPWVSAVVESDGTVRPCFFHAPIGSLANHTLLEVINGPAAVRFRETLRVPANPICNRCVCSLNY